MIDLHSPPSLAQSFVHSRANTPLYRAVFDDWLVGIEQDQICAWYEITPQQLQWSIDQSRREDRQEGER